MTPFTIVKSVAAHLPEPNIDTDAIYPARYLLLMDREGLGRYLFRDRRFTRGDVPEPSFILNQPPFSSAEILVAGSGFGCGSSREQAVWALLDFGIRCVVAPSFGEIFAGNAAQNGLLALTFDAPTIDRLAQAASQRRVIGIDLVDRVVTVDDRWVAAFAIPDAQRLAMLNGWDATDSILQQDGDAISAFEAEHRRRQPWLFQEDRTALDRGGP